MADVYVLVHGAWHTGAEMEGVAQFLRKRGHAVHCPTLAGNRPGDDKSKIGLKDAIASLIEFIQKQDLKGIRLVGHSYGGMVITGTADQIPDRIARLVYVKAFVPLDGDALNDLVPPHFVELFDAVAAQNNNAVTLPFPIWREAFINDADLALAKSSYEKLNPHPYLTFKEKISLSKPTAALEVGKSYLNCQQDASLPQSHSWHPRQSERLGLFRFVECPGSHETWFTNPAGLAEAIEVAGRD
jgi:pimeloyl-ACP methyl ester carboxylesterase